MPLSGRISFVAIPIEPASDRPSEEAALYFGDGTRRPGFLMLMIGDRQWEVESTALLNAVAAVRAANAPARCIDFLIGCSE